MSKFWVQRTTRFFSALIVLTLVGFSFVFAQVASQKSETEKINPTEIQQALTKAGFYQGTVDGVIGKKTRAAIRAFQTKNDLKADGVCGSKTWEKLKTYLEEATAMDTTATTQTDSFSPTVDEQINTGSATVQEPEPSPPSDDLKQKLVS